MKKIIYIFLLAISIISCKNDFIEESSTTSLPVEVAIRNKEDLNKGVVALYSALQGEQINDLINFSELITDNGFLSNINNGQYSEIYNMNFTPNSGKITRFWNAFNDVIIKANFVLSFQGKFDEDQDTKNLFSEAKIMRAYARLQLANYFCERLGGDNQQLGLVINDTYSPTDITATFARSSVPDTYKAIENDLLFAINNLKYPDPDDSPEFINYSPVDAKAKRMNLLSANVLMSRVQLYERNWAASIQYATAAQNMLPNIVAPYTTITESVPTNPFPVLDNQNTSSIFQLAFDTASSLGINSLYSYWGTGSAAQYKQFYATQEFYDLMPGTSTATTDSRKKLIYAPLVATIYYDNPKPIVAKKFGNSALYDVVLIRKAEIDFNIIESTYYQNPSQAQTMLNNWVVANRDPAYKSTSTGTAILDDILKQRRIEFAFEGYRFMDLKRNDQGWTKGANYLGSHPVVSISDKEQCLPIPLVETTVNLKIVQNPGY